jgi:hypothetical protein
MSSTPLSATRWSSLRAAWPWLGMAAIPGALFALKYAPRAGVPSWIGLLGYLCFFAIHCAVVLGVARRLQASPNVRRARLLFWTGCAVYAAALLAVYLRIDPMALQIDRWSALDRFWASLAHGDYPYRTRTHLGSLISGFPGLMLAVFPFWLLGDVGLLQFAALGAFALLALRVLRDTGRAAFVLLLLAGLPVFVYEAIVRSDLFSNMVLIAWMLHLGSLPGAFRGRRILLAAGAWGLLLSTRGVAIVPIVLAAFPLLRGRGPGTLLACVAVLFATFLATLLPFYLWDPAFFLDENPYLVQSGNIPGWALVLVLAITAWRAFKRGAAPALFADTGLILFATVFGCFLLKVARVGWENAVWGSKFDISYFALPVPFLLLHLGALVLPASERNPPRAR